MQQRAAALEESLEASELDKIASDFDAEERLRNNLEVLARPPPRTPPRPTAAAQPGDTPEHWRTAVARRSPESRGGGEGDDDPESDELARLDDDWQGLEEEHNDLLALLAQQEIEKNALATFLRDKVGADGVESVKRSAERDCVTKYGIYVDYDDDPPQLALDDIDDGDDAAAQANLATFLRPDRD